MDPANEYHYLPSSDSLIHSLWIDSTLVGPNVTNYFNRRAVPSIEQCDGSPIQALSLGEPHFLMKSLQELGDSLWIFMDSTEYRIYPQALPGDNWAFAPAIGISATVQSLTGTTTWGQPDSLKVIQLSSGEEIWLSQEFGIMRFPDFANPGEYFELIGISSANNPVGVQLPGVWDYFTFEVGDILQYHSDQFMAGDVGVERTTIDSKYQIGSVTTDSGVSSYHLFGIKKTTYFDSYTHLEVSSYFEYDTVIWQISESSHQFLSGHTHEMVSYEGSSGLSDCVDVGPSPTYSPVFIYLGGDSSFYYSIGRPLAIEDQGAYWGQYQVQGNSIACYKCGEQYQEVYRPGLGMTSGVSVWFEAGIETELVGYVIDGDTTGTITSDAVLTATKWLESPVTLTAYPNPSAGSVSVEWNPAEWSSSPALVILDMTGRKVCRIEKLPFSPTISLNLEDHPKGMYLIRLQGEKTAEQKLLLR